MKEPKSPYQWAIQTRNTFTDIAFPQLGLTHSEAYVWLYLHCHTDWTTGIVNVSQSRIAEDTRLSVRQLRRILKSLNEQLMLARLTKGSSFGTHSRYAVCWEPRKMHPVAKAEIDSKLHRKPKHTTTDTNGHNYGHTG